jgi:hypothetical protein
MTRLLGLPQVAQCQKIEVGQAMMQVIQRGVDQTVDVYRQVAHKESWHH